MADVRFYNQIFDNKWNLATSASSLRLTPFILSVGAVHIHHKLKASFKLKKSQRMVIKENE